MNLIIQAVQAIAANHLDHIATLSQSTQIEQMFDNVYRLTDVSPHEEIAPYCFENQVDFGFVPSDRSLSDFGMLVMDMDSTLISIECIDEIADMKGLKPKVAAITELAMRGEIDFSESLRRRVALLEGLEEQVLLRVYEDRLKLNPGAKITLAKLKKLGIKTLLVSGGFMFFTERPKARLGLDYTYANNLEIVGGKLTGKVLGDVFDAQSKAECLTRIRQELKLKPGQVISMGDGANDLKMMAVAGVSIAYHAKPVVREQASYALNFVGLDGLVNLLSA